MRFACLHSYLVGVLVFERGDVMRAEVAQVLRLVRVAALNPIDLLCTILSDAMNLHTVGSIKNEWVNVECLGSTGFGASTPLTCCV